MRCQHKAQGAENHRGNGYHEHGLGGDMVDQVRPSGAHVLGRKCCPGHRQAGTHGNHQKGDGHADGDRRHRIRTEPTDPKCIGELIARLQDVGKHNGHCQREQGARDGTGEKELLAVDGHAVL